MQDFFSKLFSSDFMPHGHCYFWSSQIVWLHVLSDLVITLSYYSIPLTLWYFARRRPDLPYRWVLVMFGGFIVACGTTHLMEIWNVWHGTYRLAGVIKAITALLSVTTAVMLVKQMPDALKLKSPTELARLNARFEAEILERKRVEAELQSERNLLRTLMDNLPDRIFFKDREGRFTRNNISHLIRFELTDQSQALGKTDADFYPKEHARLAFEDEQAVMSSRSPIHKEEKIVWPNGSVDWALVTKFPRYNERGEVIGTFGIARDINELKRVQLELVKWQKELETRVKERTEELARTNAALEAAIRRHEETEQALRRSEEQIRLVVEATPSALLMVDARGRMKMVNSQTERLFGYQREELLGQSVEMLVPARYRSQHPGLRAGYFDAPTARPMGAGRDLFGVRKGGTEIPIEIGLNPISAMEGSFVLASIIDITERKRAERAMMDSLREKETLLKEVHHRVKNNLQIISSVLQLQTGYLRDPAALNAFRESQNRIRSMALIHEQLYQAGNFARIDFGAYVQRLVKNLMASYQTSNCVVNLTHHIEAGALNLDTAIPFGLILNEAISNSLKHAFPGRMQGNICVRLRESADGTFELSVEDDGVGLPPEVTVESGSSLGLRLILILANQLHGTLEIRRHPGTTIILTAKSHPGQEANAKHAT